MSFRTTLILLVACIVVTVAAAYTERHNRAWFNRDLDQPFNFPLTSLASIEFESPQGKFRCEQYRDDAWRLTEPIEFPASFPTMERLGMLLRELRIRGTVDKERPEFGIADAKTRVRFHVGSKEYQLHFGALHPTDPFVYTGFVTEDKPPQLVLVDSTVVDTFSRMQLNEMRDDALIDVSWRRLKGLTLLRSDAVHVGLEQRDDLWWLTQPFASPADPGAVHHVAHTLNSWGIESYVADGVDPFAPGSPYGLDRPRWEVDVRSREEGRSRRVAIGGDAPADDRGRPMVYTAWRGDDHVFTASKQVLDLLATKPDEYRDHFLFRLPDPDIKGLRVSFRDDLGVLRDLILERDAEGVSMREAGESDTVPVDEELWLGLARDLRTGWLDTFLPYGAAEQKDITRYGFDNPMRIELESTDGTKDMLVVGKRVRADEAARYVINRRWNDYFGTSNLPREEDLRGAPHSLRSREVLITDPDEVIEFTIRAGGRALTFVRPHQQWRIQGLGQTVPAGILLPVLQELAKLRAVSWLGEAAEKQVADPPGPGAFEIQIDVNKLRGREDFRPVSFQIGPALPNHERLIREQPSGWLFRWQLQRDGRAAPFAYALQILGELAQ